LGDQFLSELDDAISRIVEAPYRSPLIEKDVRRFVMQRFAYSIYYRIEGEDLRILVVKHHSQHPDYWRYRLRR
jgi:toxin ParE1/3/4